MSEKADSLSSKVAAEGSKAASETSASKAESLSNKAVVEVSEASQISVSKDNDDYNTLCKLINDEKSFNKNSVGLVLQNFIRRGINRQIGWHFALVLFCQTCGHIPISQSIADIVIKIAVENGLTASQLQVTMDNYPTRLCWLFKWGPPSLMKSILNQIGLKIQMKEMVFLVFNWKAVRQEDWLQVLDKLTDEDLRIRIGDADADRPTILFFAIDSFVKGSLTFAQVKSIISRVQMDGSSIDILAKNGHGLTISQYYIKQLKSAEWNLELIDLLCKTSLIVVNYQKQIMEDISAILSIQGVANIVDSYVVHKK